MTWRLDIENVAGIRDGSGELRAGTNAVRGSNWQGKSSFLSAIRTAMGTDTPLTAGEEEGEVTLETDDDSYRTRLHRENGSVSRSGEPYLDDEYDRLCAELFAFLGGDNEVRQAVRAGDDLEPVLTQPLDLADIDEQIRSRREERDRIDRELERAEERAHEVPGLEREIEELEAELDELREREEELEAEVGAEADEEREELSDLRAERDRVTNLIERLENSVDRTEKKLEDKHEERTELDVPEDPQLDAKIADVREEIEETERELELLQSLYSLTERFLEEDKLELIGEVDHGLMGDSFECFVCGNEASKSEVRDRLDAIGDRVVDRREEIEELEDRVEELTERREEVREARKRSQDLENEITALEADLADREESLQSATERLEAIDEQLAELEDDAEESYEELTEVRSEIKYTETELEETREELEEARSVADQVETLEEQREEIAAEIADLRQRKERLRGQLREEFDDAIDELVATFDTSFEGARLTSTFDLVVARDGREVDRDALSEGERELLGIVTALAGFETYDVAEITPVILLDEIGALDDTNLGQLVDYLSDRARYLVVTAYPENTGFEDHELSPEEWDVVPPASARVEA